ncbi:glycoside hydrolase family 43 protein [Dyella sp. BiH032]|uniref:glycoside hydrolase family 43 protein n=1 Tax=Dyella sp. BiH032 TaxID=3075430 RepID=UPI0028930954|nr:glycoside hydrolase family 43 protein [Dyella sp. BiH032]WNL44690.1 glycoside hydrolase family 43 protein [Dyella sp. BiH032]
MKRPYASLRPVLVAGALCLAPPGMAAQFTNPVFVGQDPWVTYVDGTYYYSSANCGVADICVKQSKTLTGLATAPWVGVWKHGGERAPNGKEIWAPELHRIDGRWYVYYAADDGNNDHHRLFVLSSDGGPGLGSFREADTGLPHGQLDVLPDHWGIDPNVFTAADGKRYLTWSCTNQADSAFPQRICLAPMRDAVHVGKPAVLLSTPTEPWETRDKPIQEGPVGYTRNGRTYITYSGSASWIPNDYAVGLLALKSGGDPLDPSAWRKSGPIFDHHGKVYGPGSVVFVPSPDGRQYWNVYHAIERLDCKPAYDCRDVRMQPMSFDANGAPVLGTPVNPGVPLDVPSGEAGVPR